VELSDAELVGLSLHDDPEAFNTLIERHTPALYRIVRRMCSDRAEAEAITQEAFLRAWENLPRSKTGQPFWPWLVQIAVNAARDALKKSRPLDFADLPDDPEQALAADVPGPEETVERVEGLARLAAAVGQLPVPYRMVVALRYQAEMPYEEIAAVLKLPVNTVRRICGGRNKGWRTFEGDDE
jgi:RNA polymerase sigma-70 factor (ECF subfamily)